MADGLLTVATAPGYVKDKLGVPTGFGTAPFQLDGELTAVEITGGNLNYAFRVKNAAGQSIFVKQAPDFIKVFGPEAKLAKERMLLEVKAFETWAAVLGTDAPEYFPRIYNFDVDQMAFIMDFLEDYTLMQEALVANQVVTEHTACLGTVLGIMHAKTHSSKIDAEAAARFTTDFQNQSLRDIQLEYVYSKAWRDDDRAATLREDPAFMGEMEKLKSLYRGETPEDLSVVHGDLHPGSVMVQSAAPHKVKIFDPEFVVYGPPGLDVGCLLSGFILAYAKDKHTGGDGAFCASCVAQLWNSYEKSALAHGLSEAQLVKIACDAVGFAAAEAGRTALGAAGDRAIAIDDPADRARAEVTAVHLCGELLKGRSQGIKFMLEKLI